MATIVELLNVVTRTSEVDKNVGEWWWWQRPAKWGRKA